MEISHVARRYDYIQNRKINCYLINHEILARFFNYKHMVDPVLRQAGSDDKYAFSLKILLNYLAFEYANCPLFLNSNFFYRGNRLEKIQTLSKQCSESYPMTSESLTGIIATLGILSGCDDNPLLEAIEKHIGYRDAELMLINPDYTQAVMEMCDSFGIEIKISSPNTASTEIHKKGIFCGCAKFFPMSSFYAPEFEELHLVRFSWFYDSVIGHSEIYGQRPQAKRPELLISKKELIPTQPVKNNEIELNNPADEFDISMFGQYKARDTENAALSDNIDAKIVVLRGGKFVFLPADEDYKHHCLVNLNSLDRGTPAVKKIPISEFDEFTAILLREKERGDFVVDKANEIMGSRAEIFRSQQQKWKDALRGKIAEVGITQLSKELAAAGCKTVGYQNLRNWGSARFIRPLDNNDFTCLLKFLGLEAEAAMLVRNMTLIRRAHTKAGHRISEQLRNLAQNDNNLKSILIDGYRIYRTEKGGKLGVYLFERALEDKMSIPQTEAGGVKTMEAIYG